MLLQGTIPTGELVVNGIKLNTAFASSVGFIMLYPSALIATGYSADS